MPLWTPAKITTTLWLDAADSSTITESGGAVSQWDDKSGNDRHATQGTAGNRPSYQNNSVYFGSNRFLNSIALDSEVRDHTVIGVIDPPGSGDRRYVITLTHPIAARNANQRVGYWSDGSWRGTAAATTGKQILGWRLHHATNGRTYRNGQLLETLTYLDGWRSYASGNLRQIGGRFDSSFSNSSLIYLYELVYCN